MSFILPNLEMKALIKEGCQPLTRNDESDEKWVINGEFGEKCNKMANLTEKMQ